MNTQTTQTKTLSACLRFCLTLLISTCATTSAYCNQSKPSSQAAGGTDAREKLRVSDPALTRALVEQGAELFADYGSFQLLRADSDLAGKFGSHPAVENVTAQNQILFNARTLDTLSPEVAALSKSVEPSTGKRLHLVQFAGPVKPEWRRELEAFSGPVITYIPYNTYLVYADGSALAQIQTWAASASYVQWQAPYSDELKIHPRARAVTDKGEPQKTTYEFTIQMVADAQANAATLALIDRYKLEALRDRYEFLGYLTVTVALPADRLPEIAAQPEVVSIQPYDEPRKRDERQDQIVAGNLSGTNPTGPGYLAWLAAKGFTLAQFTNSGFAVDVSDSGIDNGTTYPGHFGLYESGDSSLTSRVIYNRLQGTPHTGSTIEGCDGHGTLNSHIIAGFNNLAAGFPHTDSSGFHYGLGICPFVKVGSSVIFDPDTFTSPNLPDLQSEAHEDGARISSNSWGANTSGGYNANSQAYDALVRDAQPDLSTFPNPGNQQMVIVFAAGNAGSGTGTVGAPGTAKNVITVGAAENVCSMNLANGGNNASGNDGCSTPDTGADSANDIIGFSSRGPCADQRKKPDIVAPGTHVSGGVAQESPPPATSSLGDDIACFDATGVCAVPGSGTSGSYSNFFPLGQQFYTSSSGTSHSTPAVAGCCALVRQWFINHSLTAASPAMTKAYLMNSARYLNGVGANDTLWSNSQGMGEANLGMAFDNTARVLRDQESLDKFDSTGQSRLWAGVISDASKPFRVTLAWTDAPGSTTGNAYRNDLDLVVTVGGNTYKGNVFTGASSSTGGTADPRNNVESVFIPAGVTGNWVATVTAANLNSDGVPNEDPTIDQDFALVIYNAVEVPTPVIVPGTTSLSTESCNPPNSAVDPGETVTMNFALSNAGTSNTTSVVATLLATGGVSSPSSPQNYGALIAGGGSVSKTYSFTASGVCGSNILATFQLQDGANNLGTVSFSIPLGVLGTVNSENFDAVSIPALPSGWTTAASGGAAPWVTTNYLSDSAPNSAYARDATTAGLADLESAGFVVPAVGSQLTFRHNYVTESGYDGCVLEIKIGGGSYTDILTAGGSFAAGGYNGTINGGTSANPLTNRPAWTGNGGGFFTTTVNLPVSTVGQTVQFRWRIGTDGSVGAAGWYVDSLTLMAPFCCGSASAPIAGFSGTPLSGFAPMPVTFADTSVGVVTNRHWDFGNGFSTNTLATNFVYTYGAAGTYTVSLTAQNPYGSSIQTRTNYITVTNAIPVLSANTYSLSLESCTNNGVDPNENVSVSFNIKNNGSASTTNLVVTLLAGGGVTSPSGPQNYGAIPPAGGSTSRTFSFVAFGTCGSNILATFQLQDGATSFGTVSYTIGLGTVGITFNETFDGVVAPNLPAGWVTYGGLSGQTNWTTSALANTSSPNAAFSPDGITAGTNELISPVIAVPASGGQLSFRNNYNLEASTSTSSTYDGGVLEIKIGGGSFLDITNAGGTFVSGGYTRKITAASNPLGLIGCWSGNSGGFTNTLINLPPSAFGQNVQFRWRCGTDSSVGRPGWYIDDVRLFTITCCGNPPIAGFNATPLEGAAPLPVTFTDSTAGVVTNRYWNFGNGASTNTMATNFVYTYPGAGLFSVTLTAVGPSGSNVFTRSSYISVTNPIPVVSGDNLSLMIEGCINGGVDPNETVTVSIRIRNTGTAATTNLVGTLLAATGIGAPSGPQSYGAIPPGGGTVTRNFSFKALGNCGDQIVATIQLNDGPTSFGTLYFPITLGVWSVGFAENWDAETPPNIPGTWSTSASGSQFPWETTADTNHTAPNAVFSPDPDTVGENELLSPIVNMPNGPSQLSFWHKYELEGSTTTGYDGGVLEIDIAGGGFMDILDAGGSFVSGGYTRTISGSFSSPIAGRLAWSGTNATFTNVVVDLPPGAAGQPVQFKWRCATDSSVSKAGWYVDTINTRVRTCCTESRPFLIQPKVNLGVFSCILTGAPGAYVIETGTNFNFWSPAGTVTNVTGSVPFTDTNSVKGIRVFRAKTLP